MSYFNFNVLLFEKWNLLLLSGLSVSDTTLQANHYLYVPRSEDKCVCNVHKYLNSSFLTNLIKIAEAIII